MYKNINIFIYSERLGRKLRLHSVARMKLKHECVFISDERPESKLRLRPVHISQNFNFVGNMSTRQSFSKKNVGEFH